MYIGIDIGGSHIGFAVLDEEYNIFRKEEILIENEKTINEVLRILKDRIQKNLDCNIKSIGIAFPGICDVKNKKIINTSNIQLSENIDLVREIEKEFKIPTYLDNDIKCAMIAECLKGNLRNVDNAIFLGVGTGIGSALLLNGKIYRGSTNTAGEVGHMVISKDGITCGCGRRGCFEKYASLASLKKRFEESGIRIGYHEYFKVKNPEAIHIRNEWLNDLAEGIANMYNILDVEKIVIGGGFSKYLDSVKSNLIYLIRNKVYNQEKEIVIESSKLENTAGIVGAGMLEKVLKEEGYE